MGAWSVLQGGARQGPVLGTTPVIPALIPAPPLTRCLTDAQGLGFSACQTGDNPNCSLT